MKTSEKLQYINDKIELINTRVLKNRNFKILFNKVGTNNYCLNIKDKEFKFNTYDDVISCIDLIRNMFMIATTEIKKEKSNH